MALGYGKKRFKKVTGKCHIGKRICQCGFSRAKDSVISPRMPLEEIVFLDTWGNKATVDELVNRAVYEPLNYARMAPSTLNRQPWRFIIDGRTADSYSQGRRGYESLRGTDRRGHRHALLQEGDEGDLM